MSMLNCMGDRILPCLKKIVVRHYLQIKKATKTPATENLF